MPLNQYFFVNILKHCIPCSFTRHKTSPYNFPQLLIQNLPLQVKTIFRQFNTLFKLSFLYLGNCIFSYKLVTWPYSRPFTCLAVRCCPFCKKYAKLHFNAKYLENRLKYQKYPFLANIGCFPNFLYKALVPMISTSSRPVTYFQIPPH